jgi:hypothetical protein
MNNFFITGFAAARVYTEACHRMVQEHKVPNELWNLTLSLQQIREYLENAFDHLPPEAKVAVLEVESKFSIPPQLQPPKIPVARNT